MPLLKSIFYRSSEAIDCMPIKKNVYKEKGKALVSQVKVKDDLKKSVKLALDKINGLNKSIKKGDSVLIKPNYVFPQKYPCTTKTDFLQAVIELIKEQKPSRIAVGEAPFIGFSTEKIMDKFGALKVCRDLGAEVLPFEKREWVKVNLNTEHFKTLSFPKDAFEFDRIVYLPNMKTHRLARFTLSLKLTMGFPHPLERQTKIHLGGNLEKKVAEFNKAIHPDLIIMDARQCFVTGGPRTGQLENPNLILASGDRIAIDAAALRHLLSYKADNLLAYNNPFMYDQIKTAAELGLGVKSEEEIKAV